MKRSTKCSIAYQNGGAMATMVMGATSLRLLTQQYPSILAGKASRGPVNSVSPSLQGFVLMCSIFSMIVYSLGFQLKAVHKTIYIYAGTTSGTHWDNTKGANIIGEAANRTWESHLTTAVRALFF